MRDQTSLIFGSGGAQEGRNKRALWARGLRAGEPGGHGVGWPRNTEKSNIRNRNGGEDVVGPHPSREVIV